MISSVAVMALAFVSSMGIWGCQRSENGRLMDESLGGLGYELVNYLH